MADASAAVAMLDASKKRVRAASPNRITAQNSKTRIEDFCTFILKLYVALHLVEA